MKYIIAVLFLLWTLPALCFSQEDTLRKPVKLVLTDGSELIGSVVLEDSINILFETKNNIKITVPKEKLKKIEILTGHFEGNEYIRHDPNDTRLFFASTARTLNQGQGYFSAYEIFFPSLAFGITDYFTLSGGISLIPGAESQLTYITPKIRFVHIKNFDLSASFQYMSSFGYNFGIGYGIATYGNQRASVTAGLGWGYVDGKFSNSPALILGGESQLSNSVKLITENWFPPKSDVAIISFGIRFFGENIAGDFGLMTTTKSGGGFPFIPWVGFAYNFGKRK